MRLESSGLDKDQRRVLVKEVINLPLSQKEGNVFKLPTPPQYVPSIDSSTAVSQGYTGLRIPAVNTAWDYLFVMHVFLRSIERFQAPKGIEYKNMTMHSVLGDYPEGLGSRLLRKCVTYLRSLHGNISEGRTFSTI
jgi:hypothetical protein